MPCCHVPIPLNPAFPNALIPDAERFAKYVGGAPLAALGNPDAVGILTSALHLEMQLWEPTKFTWYINDSQRNAWGVMSNRTTAPAKVFPRFVQRGQCLVFSSFALPPCADGCCLVAFDAWLLSKLVELRNEGLAHAGLVVWEANPHIKPPELGTFGLAQKLINIFLKYEVCWQAVGQWVNGQMVPYQPPVIPNLPSYLCALHAPIDRILLDALGSLALGKWLKKNKLFNATSQLKQSSDGSFRPWSKLDCLRTYYGLQLMLRKVAMRTWPPGCACAESTNAAIQKCADWFNRTYGNDHPCESGQLDWIEVACDLPESISQETLKELRLSPIASSSAPNNAQRPAFKHQVEVCAGCTEQTVTVSARRGKLTIHLEQGPEKYIKLVDKCGGPNDGMICLHGNPHIWLKNQKPNRRYLIGEVAAAGGHFTNEAGYVAAPGGVPNCGVGGTNYQGGVPFGSVEDAVKYLKRYFSVQACPGNRGLHGHPTCNQAWIDGI